MHDYIYIWVPKARRAYRLIISFWEKESEKFYKVSAEIISML